MSNTKDRGEAAGYYQEAPPQSQQYGGDQRQYGGQQPQQQQQYGMQEQNYGQAPPQYGNNSYAPQNYEAQGEKQDFQQAFKLDKPKFNDLWAGLLFLAVFFGFAAVSGITLQGYAKDKGLFGGGIYDSKTEFGLDTNTVVLFVFCLAVAIVLSYGYVWLARIFTKQFIWTTGILNILFGLVTAIYMLSRKYWSGGMLFNWWCSVDEEANCEQESCSCSSRCLQSFASSPGSRAVRHSYHSTCDSANMR
jgi:hypothetical protein